MAVIKPVMTELQRPDANEAWKVVWANILAADTCDPVSLVGYNDRSVAVTGTFDSATIVIHGSLDGTNFAAMRDPSLTALSFTSAALKAILEAALELKPLTSGGGGSSSVTVTMFFTRPKR